MKALVVANPLEVVNARGVFKHSTWDLYRMWYGGPYTTYDVYVWADNFEDAWEVLVEYMDVEAPGHLLQVRIPDLKVAAEELGIKWKQRWNAGFDPGDDGDALKVVEHAEADLTLIGHTTLKHGQYVRSDEWGGGEVDDGDPDFADVVAASLAAARQQYWQDEDEWRDQLGAMTPRGREIAASASGMFSRRRRGRKVAARCRIKAKDIAKRPMRGDVFVQKVEREKRRRGCAPTAKKTLDRLLEHGKDFVVRPKRKR